MLSEENLKSLLHDLCIKFDDCNNMKEFRQKAIHGLLALNEEQVLSFCLFSSLKKSFPSWIFHFCLHKNTKKTKAKRISPNLRCISIRFIQ
jgi:hypothetical protein